MANIPMVEMALDRPIAFHRNLVDVTGSVPAALMLSQALYWSQRCRDPEGWFWKTSAEWQEETGLTRHEQDTVRRILKEKKIWDENLGGQPARMFYRINFETLVAEMSKVAVQIAARREAGRSGKPAFKPKPKETAPRADRPYTDAFAAAFKEQFGSDYVWMSGDFVQINAWLKKVGDRVTVDQFIAVLKFHWKRGQYTPGLSLTARGAVSSWSKLVATKQQIEQTKGGSTPKDVESDKRAEDYYAPKS